MKILQILVLIFGLSVILNAQVDCSVTDKIFVRDYDGNTVKNAKLEIFKVDKGFNKSFAFAPQKFENDAYLISSFMGTLVTNSNKRFYVGESYWLKVTAENFKIAERSIKFDRCKSQEINVILEQVNQKIKLTGIVYDLNGAIVIETKITATNKQGEIFTSETNSEGIYSLKLLPAIYKIQFEHPHFKKLVMEEYQIVNSTYGKISQDVVFRKVIDPEPCGYSGADCLPTSEVIEKPKTKVSDTISERPLEELPKAENKNKRKNNKQ